MPFAFRELDQAVRDLMVAEIESAVIERTLPDDPGDAPVVVSGPCERVTGGDGWPG